MSGSSTQQKLDAHAAQGTVVDAKFTTEDLVASGPDGHLALRVFTGGQADFYASQTLISGDEHAVLIDVPFTRSYAHRIVAEILDAGKELTHIYITHSHPDHYFSAPVFLDAFPAAKLVSLPKICLNIGISVPGRLFAWSSMLGTNGPGNVVVPIPYEQDHIELEGERLVLLGPMAGDHPDSTAVHIPSLNALVTGDIAFNGFHLFLTHGGKAYRQAWLASLDRLMAMEPDVVVAGHSAPGRSSTPETLRYTREYLVAFEEVVAQSANSEAAIEAMKAHFPDSVDVMGDFVLTLSAQVATGEAEPIVETDGMEDYL